MWEFNDKKQREVPRTKGKHIKQCQAYIIILSAQWMLAIVPLLECERMKKKKTMEFIGKGFVGI